MKKNILILQFVIIALLLSGNIVIPQKAFAAFPINTQQQDNIENSTFVGAPQKLERNQVYSGFQKARTGQGGDVGVFGIISFCTAIIGLVAETPGLAILAILLSFVTGLVGVQRDKKLKGLAIAGLALSSIVLLIFLIAISVVV